MWPIPSSLPIITTGISNHLYKTMWCNYSWAWMNDYIPQKTVGYSTDTVYTPVWKTDVLCRGDVRPSVLSVCLFVRPSVWVFRTFFSTCFEISIWNLVYAFSRWHDMSSLNFITIGSLWPSLQPKVGQTQFLQSWPYKSRQIIQIWYVDDLLYTSRHKFCFFAKVVLLEFWWLFMHILDFAKFSELFSLIFWDIDLKHGIYI